MASNSTISIGFKMEDSGNGFKQLVLDAESFKKAMRSAVKEANKLKPAIVNFAAFATGINAANNSLQQLMSVIGDITAESADFDKAMREANTMAEKDSAGFKQLKGEVANLAKEIPIARDQLANGLYQTISNGVPEDNWIEFLNTSARSAVGGLADINKVVGVTSTLIKNYGLEWSAAADIQDKIQLTAKNGVTSFEQLSQALPRVAGNAATLGVSIDELMGTFATLTGVSGNTAEVSTQLAAIFTSLVKPSSEATKMAAEMGIQFDAAAIKAAGGFQNFLTQLDSSVKAYAQATGVLEQEVYGRLFGSAEAVRALIPLQGELAEKFTANISTMVDSAGTMDAAYADMSSHGEAVSQMLRNQWAAFRDTIYTITSVVQPYLDWGNAALNTLTNVVLLTNGLKALNVQHRIAAAKAAIANGVFKVLSVTSKKTALGIEMMAAVEGQAARQAKLLKIALRGLVIATGIGVAIAAVTAIIEHFSSSVDDATDSIEKLDDATDDYKQAAAAAKVQIGDDIKALGDLIAAKKDTAEAVRHLNETYGELFGVHKTAEEWYKILTQSSQAYVEQIGYEAQARSLATKVAEASINKQLAAERKAELERAGVDSRGRVKTKTAFGTFWLKSEEYEQALKDLETAEKTEAELEKRLNIVRDKASKISLGPITTKENPTPSNPSPSKQENTPPPEGSIAAISQQISTLQTKINLSVDEKSRAELYQELAMLEERKRMIEFKYKFPYAPEQPDLLPSLNTNLETDIAKVKPVIEDLSGAFGNMGQKAKVSAKDAAGAFNQLGSSISGLGNALEVPELNVAGTMAQAIATMVAGYAQATEEGALLGPFGWLAFAATGLAQLTAMVSAVKGLPAFANGGIVSGPTVGLIGEYAGASNNPEVVAPLDKLRGMLNPIGEPVIIGGTIRAKGREIIVALANETRLASKSGKRTNIII